MKKLGIVSGLLAILLFLFLNADFWGHVPDENHREILKKSKQYNAETEQFENRQRELHRKMNEENFNATTLPDTLSKWWNNKAGVPDRPLPSLKPDFKKFLQPSDDFKVIWFGHSTFMVRLNNKTILVDPIFSKSAFPLGFIANRFQAPAATLEQLPEIDYILISHDHFDHLDMKSIKFFRGTKTKFVLPLGLSSHLFHWGITRDRMTELDWWEEFEVEGLKFVCTPSQHFSGRDLFHSNKTLWASWVIQAREHKLFFSGDSGYDIHFKQIGEKYGPFKVAFMETGQYNKLWQAIHMLPEEGAKAFLDLGANYYFPVHWGMFELSIHSWFEPIQEIQRLSKELNFDLLVPRFGEVVSSEKLEERKIESWWLNLID